MGIFNLHVVDRIKKRKATFVDEFSLSLLEMSHKIFRNLRRVEWNVNGDEIDMATRGWRQEPWVPRKGQHGTRIGANREARRDEQRWCLQWNPSRRAPRTTRPTRFRCDWRACFAARAAAVMSIICNKIWTPNIGEWGMMGRGGEGRGICKGKGTYGRERWEWKKGIREQGEEPACQTRPQCYMRKAGASKAFARMRSASSSTPDYRPRSSARASRMLLMPPRSISTIPFISSS